MKAVLPGGAADLDRRIRKGTECCCYLFELFSMSKLFKPVCHQVFLSKLTLKQNQIIITSVDLLLPVLNNINFWLSIIKREKD